MESSRRGPVSNEEASRTVRAFSFVAGGLSLVALFATLGWLALTFQARPLDGVEGDVLFEADRIRAGLPLYVDPFVGAHDYGPVPARYHVLYPPLWPALLSLVPREAAPSFARAVAAASWWLLLAMIATKARAACKRPAVLASLFVGSVWVLGLYGSAGRPDALAVLFAGLALERTVRRSSVRGAPAIDPIAGALFALAAWTKPNVIGIAPGVFAAALVTAVVAARRASPGPRADIVRGFAAAVAVGAVVALVLGKLTGGAFLAHLFASTGQPPSLALWIEQTRDRAPFFAVLFAVAFLLGVKNRADPGVAIALGALVSSVGWCFVSLAKTGSASNYFLEPCVAALVVVARAPAPDRTPIVVAALVVLQALWTGVASVKSATSSIVSTRLRADAIAAAKAECRRTPSELVIADEPGLELMLNARIVQTPYQSTHLARAGRFPTAAWIADVTHPSVRCLVMQDDLLDRPLDLVDVEHDRFGPELRRALRDTFVKRGERDGIHVYERRPAR